MTRSIHTSLLNLVQRWANRTKGRDASHINFHRRVSASSQLSTSEARFGPLLVAGAIWGRISAHKMYGQDPVQQIESAGRETSIGTFIGVISWVLQRLHWYRRLRNLAMMPWRNCGH